MKQLLTLSLILCVFIACKNTSTTQEVLSTAKLKGKIINPVGKQITLTSIVPFGEKSSTDTLLLDDEGNFEGEFIVEKPQYVRLNHKEYATLYLTPNDELNITVNIDSFDETIVYTGKGADANNYLKDKVLLEEDKLPGVKDLYSLEYNDFKEKIGTYKEIQETRLTAFKGLSTDFIKSEKRNNQYKWVNLMSRYSRYHKHFTKKEEVEDNSKDYMDIVDLNDASSLQSMEYTMFIGEYLSNETTKHIKENELDESDSNLYFKTSNIFISKLFKNDKIKTFLEAKNLHDRIKYLGVNGVDSDYEKFKSKEKYKPYLASINEQYDKWAPLKTGALAKDFEIVDLEGQKKKLSDYRGKYVYIDVWATWCGPCRGEIPHLEKLQEEYEDKNIVFMSVSIDNKKETWARMVKDKKMKGEQVFIEGAWNSSLAKDYNIGSIPRFMLIDKEGKIISANEKRPSSKSIRALFNGLDGIAMR